MVNNNILEQLASCYGAPGEESELIELILEILLGKKIDSNLLPVENENLTLKTQTVNGIAIEVSQDRVGNLIVRRLEKEKKSKVSLVASLDEAALFITHIKENGLLCFDSAGIIPYLLPGKQFLVGKNKIPGVIGFVPIHLQRRYDLLQSEIKTTKLSIDIGARTKDEALKLVTPGEWAVFNSGYNETDGVITSRALDNRLAVAALVETILNKEVKTSITALFTRVRKPWSWGSVAVSFGLKSQFNLILDVTAADDGPAILSPDKYYREESRLGDGPVLTIFDGGHISDIDLFKCVSKVAEKENIPFQIKQSSLGASEASAFQTEAGGGKSLTLSVPCRYQNAPWSLALKSDLENLIKLIQHSLAVLKN